jgi:hypothetical protein
LDYIKMRFVKGGKALQNRLLEHESTNHTTLAKMPIGSS